MKVRNLKPVSHFLVSRFALLPLLLAPAASADVVHNDDVIIDGSLAVGNSAVNGESFGFDTLRLKEDNLRFHFDDTSGSASFPANDWRLIANDSSNGGANYFSIEDATAGKKIFRVDAGAPVDSLRVENSGNVGFGTSNPVVKLHMVDGDSTTLRLEQNGSSGFTAQTWDVAGNETNFFVRDVTHDSKLPFKIKPDSPDDSLYIAPAGVGIGNDNPQAKLHVTGTALIEGTLEIGSSRDLKENIRELTIEEARTTLNELNPVSFNYKIGGETQIGFIAEDVPDLVATKNRRSIIPMDFVGVLTKVVQANEQREIALREKVISQEQLIEGLTERLESLEERLQSSEADNIPQTQKGR
jgi:hypothetical protein